MPMERMAHKFNIWRKVMNMYLKTAFLVVSLTFATGEASPVQSCGFSDLQPDLNEKPLAVDTKHLPFCLQELNLIENQLAKETQAANPLLLLLMFFIVGYIIVNYDTAADSDDSQWDNDKNF
jgi:hypothetical protein